MENIVDTPVRKSYKDGTVIISNIRNPFTNKLTSYLVTNTWHDGTVMDDSKVDSFGIYTKYKITGEYLRENLPFWGENYLELNSVQHLRDLDPQFIHLIWIGYYKGVRLNGYWQKGDTKKPVEYHKVSVSEEIDDGGSLFIVGNLFLKRNFVGEVDVRYFGATGNIQQNCYSILERVWRYCIENKVDIYHPSGIYNTFTNNFPYKTLLPNDQVLFDCKKITVRGDGDSTTFMTETPTGADVMNLYKCKNITLKDFHIDGILTGSNLYGTNGISVVSGYDGIFIRNISVSNLVGIQKPHYTESTDKGNWDASSNLPSLQNSVPGNDGDFYTVTVAGNQNFGGSTNFDFKVGDVVVFGNGVYWKQSYFIDGGKALTIQNGESPLELGTIKADIRVKGCGYGFGIDFQNHNFITKKTAIEIDVIAEECHRAISLDGNFNNETPTPSNRSANIIIRGLAINCQEDLFLRNTIGADVNLQVSTTKTAEERRKIPSGARYWNVSNKKVNSVRAYNAMLCKIDISGYKGECDAKYEIGGEQLPINSGYSGATENSELRLNVIGNTLTPFILVNAGGNYIRNSNLLILSERLDDLPALLFWNSRNNLISTREGQFVSALKTPKVSFLTDNSGVVQGEIKFSPSGGVTVRQLLSNVIGQPIFSADSFNGSRRVRVFNSGTVELTNSNDVSILISSGEILPEGNLNGLSGDLYIRTAIVSGVRIAASLWFKQSISGNTGWVKLDNSMATTTVPGLVKKGKHLPNGSSVDTLLQELRDIGLLSTS